MVPGAFPKVDHGRPRQSQVQPGIIWGIFGASSGACLGPGASSGACLGPHLGHVWGSLRYPRCCMHLWCRFSCNHHCHHNLHIVRFLLLQLKASYSPFLPSLVWQVGLYFYFYLVYNCIFILYWYFIFVCIILFESEGYSGQHSQKSERSRLF